MARRKRSSWQNESRKQKQNAKEESVSFERMLFSAAANLLLSGRDPSEMVFSSTLKPTLFVSSLHYGVTRQEPSPYRTELSLFQVCYHDIP
eukprot:1918312-Rhodomonas_salina.1